MIRLIIMRHGNTFETGQLPRRIGSRTDVPLTAAGEHQAAAMGRWFDETGYAPELALCGPLRRTVATARLVIDSAGLTLLPQLAGFLDEIDYGPDENMLEDRVIDRIGRSALDAWDRDGAVPNGWQVDREARIAAWRQLATLDDGITIMLVTSNGAARFAFDAFAIERPPTGVKLRTGAIGELVIGRQTASVVRWNVRPGE